MLGFDLATIETPKIEFRAEYRTVINTFRKQEKPEFKGMVAFHDGFVCVARENNFFIHGSKGLFSRGACLDCNDGMAKIAEILGARI